MIDEHLNDDMLADFQMLQKKGKELSELVQHMALALKRETDMPLSIVFSVLYGALDQTWALIEEHEREGETEEVGKLSVRRMNLGRLVCAHKYGGRPANARIIADELGEVIAELDRVI